MSEQGDHLVAGYVDGALSADEREELERLVGENDSAAHDLIDQVMLHRELELVLGTDEEIESRAAERILLYLEAQSDGRNFLEEFRARQAAAEAPAPAPLQVRRTTSARLPVVAGGAREYAVTLNSTGIHYISVDPAGPLPAINSNPFVVVDSLVNQPQLFWGDLHGHHGHVYTDSHGHRVDEYMAYARNVADLDFACESHKSSSYDNTMEVHEEIAVSMGQYNDPGQFVTIRGYEWMGDGDTQGHHNYYFSSSIANIWIIWIMF